MKTISATDAKNKFGDLMTSISAGPIAITKNGKVAAYLSPANNAEDRTLTAQKLNEVLEAYSAGTMTRRNVEEATGLWFSDLLSELGRRNLPLPRVDSTVHLNENQRTLFNTIFHKR